MAAREAVELALVAFENIGFGLNVKCTWLNKVIHLLARREAANPLIENAAMPENIGLKNFTLAGGLVVYSARF